MTQLLTTPQLARALSLCERTVNNLAAKGAIPRIKIGSSVRYNLPEVVDALKSSTKPTSRHEKTFKN
jgi:predicted DNA-binding transcriptional regulator AlpA